MDKGMGLSSSDVAAKRRERKTKIRSKWLAGMPLQIPLSLFV
jgi:hypothetical protein